MDEPEDRASLKDLDARIKAARSRQAEASGRKAGGAARGTGTGLGFRLAFDLVSGLVVGVGLGLLLDYWLGTGPLFLIAFFFLGAAAGMLNVYRTATGQGFAVGYREAEEPGSEGSRPDDRASGDGER